ncbi:MAG: sporulation transcriptional regulator SpoIIID [Bacilli bacterium]|nr:sporulation transcriptional regulator SpoIIID [Bacilli bacterium]
MNKKIISRVIEEGKYMLATGKTVRELAQIFGISKSTIHKDLRERLLEIDSDMYKQVSSILQYHMDIRHIRGGESTRRKFLEKNANY